MFRNKKYAKNEHKIIPHFVQDLCNINDDNDHADYNADYNAEVKQDI